MGFEKELGIVRKYCRVIVLPSTRIKTLIEKFIHSTNVENVIDMGSGTLFWSEWFAKYIKTVYAIDLIYNEGEEKVGERKNIHKIRNIYQVIEKDIGKNTVFWMCDVMHHLNNNYAEKLLDICMNKYNYIIIKDMNKWKKIGNQMNKLHDKLFNHEIAKDVDPYQLISKLKNRNYIIEYYEIPRLWYPHFLIMARKQGWEADKKLD